MLQYANTLDLTKIYEEKFEQLFLSLDLVKGESEYVEFIRENKR